MRGGRPVFLREDIGCNQAGFGLGRAPAHHRRLVLSFRHLKAL